MRHQRLGESPSDGTGWATHLLLNTNSVNPISRDERRPPRFLGRARSQPGHCGSTGKTAPGKPGPDPNLGKPAVRIAAELTEKCPREPDRGQRRGTGSATGPGCTRAV